MSVSAFSAEAGAARIGASGMARHRSRNALFVSEMRPVRAVSFRERTPVLPGRCVGERLSLDYRPDGPKVIFSICDRIAVNGLETGMKAALALLALYVGTFFVVIGFASQNPKSPGQDGTSAAAQRTAIDPAKEADIRSLMELVGAKDTIEERSEERRVGKECRSRWSPYH